MGRYSGRFTRPLTGGGRACCHREQSPAQCGARPDLTPDRASRRAARLLSPRRTRRGGDVDERAIKSTVIPTLEMTLRALDDATQRLLKTERAAQLALNAVTNARASANGAYNVL